LVKRVPDTASVFKIAGDGKAIDTAGLKFVMSPYDEYAVEEAIKIKEAGGAQEVLVVSMGPAECAETMRTALAMGADAGLLVTGPGVDGLSSKGAAEALAAALRPLGAGLILAGKQAVDDDAAQVPERVAELLDLPHASVVSRVAPADGKVVVDREIEGGKHTLELPLPALLTIEKGINTPRYPTLPNIMKAKKKPLEEKTLADLGVAAPGAGVAVASMALPRQERRARILEGDTAARVQALVKALKEDEQVL
jgi:electron transfer flavoprotein beta subunit